MGFLARPLVVWPGKAVLQKGRHETGRETPHQRYPLPQFYQRPGESLFAVMRLLLLR